MIRCLLFLFLLMALSILIFFTVKDHYKKIALSPSLDTSYKGLCLFDIDGTLTTGQHNEKSIDICLKNGWAVGISTAGAMYDPSNLLSFSWMPKNLYDFMAKHNWTTFNNVARNIYAGKSKQQPNYDKEGHKKWGILKGHSLLETAQALNIIPQKNNLILFDNDPAFMEGTKMFPQTQAICAGYPCSQHLILNPNLVLHTLNST